MNTELLQAIKIGHLNEEHLHQLQRALVDVQSRNWLNNWRLSEPDAEIVHWARELLVK